MNFQEILAAVRSLPTADRERLVHCIQEEMQVEDVAVDPVLAPAVVREIQRRVAALEADPTIGVPWEEVESRMQEQLKELGE